MRTESFRPGQLGAFTVVYERVVAAEPYTSIVLPTRYGKSDVMRAAVHELWTNKVICCGIVLSPNDYLRSQMGSLKKADEAVQRYGLGALGFKIATLDSYSPDFASNGEAFVSTTIQLVQNNVEFFVQWVEMMVRRTGRPPLFIVDETEGASTSNRWGAAVARLVASGARAALFTATPNRSDGEALVGFRTKERDAEPIKVTKTSPGSTPERIQVDIYEGCKKVVEIDADYMMTFAEAWKEVPSPLCTISRVPFDVDMSKADSTGVEPGHMLSALSRAEVKGVLGRAVRWRVTVDAGVRSMVDILRQYRRLDPACAAVVFSSNDTDSDGDFNKHAKMIRDAIEQEDQDLDVLIATTADGKDGLGRLTKFVAGRGDVLIVKQMAGRGIDVPRAKVALDLSPVRTVSAWIQRLMRIATPFGGIRTGTWISPADKMQEELFVALVADSSGATMVELVDLLKSYEKDRDEAPEKPSYMGLGTRLFGFDDTKGHVANANAMPITEAIVREIPELLNFMSHAEVAKRAQNMNLAVGLQPEAVVDTGAMGDLLRVEINDIAKAIHGQRHRFDKSMYGDQMRAIWIQIYDAAGIGAGTRLADVRDIAKLHRIKASAEYILQRGSAA